MNFAPITRASSAWGLTTPRNLTYAQKAERLVAVYNQEPGHEVPDPVLYSLLNAPSSSGIQWRAMVRRPSAGRGYPQEAGQTRRRCEREGTRWHGVRREASTPGTIADTVAHLALWARLAPRGFARVEYHSEFARSETDRRLGEALQDEDDPLPSDRVAGPFHACRGDKGASRATRSARTRSRLEYRDSPRRFPRRRGPSSWDASPGIAKGSPASTTARSGG